MQNYSYQLPQAPWIKDSATETSEPRIGQIALYMVAHAVLALLMSQFEILSTIHALGAFAVGLYILSQEDSQENLIYLVGYMAASEVVWRATGANVFWEFGKYAISALLLLGIFKERRLGTVSKWPFVYFLMLTPAIVLLPYFDRQLLSFYLSGPFTLAVAATYFSGLKLTLHQTQYLLLIMLGPIVGMAVLASSNVISAGGVVGKKGGSGGFGPNQVSSIFGLGMVCAFYVAMLIKDQRILRIGMILTTIWMAGQAALTGSRGGFWTGVGAIVIATLFLLQDRRTRGIFLTGAVITVMLLLYFVFPALDSITGGFTGQRFQDFDLTGRDDIMRVEWSIFLDNPLMGVGVGQSELYYDDLSFASDASHTEYTRMLAEHGSFGVLALLIMLLIATSSVLKNQQAVSRAFAASAATYALLFIFHAATRLAAPSFLFGLAAIEVFRESEIFKSEIAEPAPHDAEQVESRALPSTRRRQQMERATNE